MDRSLKTVSIGCLEIEIWSHNLLSDLSVVDVIDPFQNLESGSFGITNSIYLSSYHSGKFYTSSV